MRVLDTAMRPVRATAGSSGFDLCAHVPEPVIIPHSCSRVIPTGVFLNLTRGWEGQIRSRSGLAAKSGIFVLNSPGTIDSDYRGELKVILFNSGTENFTVNPNAKIAQIVFNQVYAYEGNDTDIMVGDYNLVTELDETNRGQGGFGSTGS